MRPPNFNKVQLDVLMDWLEINYQNPYPAKQSIFEMKNQTGLTEKQINLWCTNARRVSHQFYFYSLYCNREDYEL